VFARGRTYQAHDERLGETDGLAVALLQDVLCFAAHEISCEWRKPAQIGQFDASSMVITLHRVCVPSGDLRQHGVLSTLQCAQTRPEAQILALGTFKGASSVRRFLFGVGV